MYQCLVKMEQTLIKKRQNIKDLLSLTLLILPFLTLQPRIVLKSFLLGWFSVFLSFVFLLAFFFFFESQKSKNTKRPRKNTIKTTKRMCVLESYYIRGVGSVATGIIVQGKITLNTLIFDRLSGTDYAVLSIENFHKSTDIKNFHKSRDIEKPR